MLGAEGGCTAKIRELCYNPAVLLVGLARVDAPSPYNDTGGTIMRNTELLNKIDAAIAEKNMLKHPFYQDWQAGKLSREALQLYAAQYYRHVEAFPKHLRGLAARTEGPIRDIVLENLAEEENPAGPHPKLWREFAAALGGGEDDITCCPALPGTQAVGGKFPEIVGDRAGAGGGWGLYGFRKPGSGVAARKNCRPEKNFWGEESGGGG